ncbi:ABC transporter ATP-binding protein [uncultured Desulfuromusa sp.]|uniref:ABC transporter ATP-binding protein n=1 Tax=uncultured Desulfuromusa sp. TaxID=219183 RepID=UPI002AA6FB70|nr:ABC transporter ATP-binding protein [uncultured Desulfuromusa sp.]
MAMVLENITKQVARESHIKDISLQLEPGTFNVLLGRTLSGKTTLMRLMAGLDRPSQGRILMNGKDLTGLPIRKRDVAMVYQQFINYPSMTVYKNIASPLRLAKVPEKEIDLRVREVAEILHIEPLLERLPVELSGGQQQRTAIARALVKDTELLLLDEPLVNLDYKLREELRIEMREIFKLRKSIVVYATTEPLEALALGGNTAVLYEGQLEQFGDTIDVYQHPKTTRIAQAFSDPAMNFVTGEIDADNLSLGSSQKIPRQQHFAQLKPGKYQLGMRPNHLQLTQQKTTDIAFKTTIGIAEISGSETFVHVVHNDHSWIAQLQGIHKYTMGEEVEVFINPSHLYVFNPQGHLVASPNGASAVTN